MVQPARAVGGAGQGSSRHPIQFQQARDTSDPTTGMIQLDEALLREVFDSFWIPTQSGLKKSDLSSFLPLALQLFRDSDWKVSLGFRETSVPLPNKDWLKLAVADGASVCMGARAQQGLISMPDPIFLHGFSGQVAFLTQPIDKIMGNEAGGVVVSFPCFDEGGIELTPQLMASPLGELFPSGMIEPVALTQLPERLKKVLAKKTSATPAAEPSLVQNLTDHLDTLALGALIYTQGRTPEGSPLTLVPGGVCHPTAASLQVFLKIPELRENLEKGLYQQFDFSGVESASLYWPKFPLKDLPFGFPFEILSGTADILANYDKGQSALLLELHNLDLVVRWENNAEALAAELSGGLRVKLKPGGMVEVEFVNLRVRIPEFSSHEKNLFSFSGVLVGSIQFHWERGKKIELKKSEVTLQDLQLKTSLNQKIALPKLPGGISGTLEGMMGVLFDPENPGQQIQAHWDLKAGVQFAPISPVGPQFDMKNFTSEGEISFAKIGDRFFPNLADTRFTVQTDLKGEKAEKELFEVDQFLVRFEGAGKSSSGNETLQEADLTVGAQGIYAGQFAWIPKVRLHLKSRQTPDQFTGRGEGEWKLGSIIPKKILEGDAMIVPATLEVGTKIAFRTDGEQWHWQLHMDEDQRIGPTVLSGELKVEGDNGTFAINTPQPLSIQVNEKALIEGFQLSGGRDKKSFHLQARIASILKKARAQFSVSILGKEPRLAGSYLVQPLAGALPHSEKYSLEELQLHGVFNTPTLGKMLEKPMVFLKGNAQGHLAGELKGPLVANYDATLLYFSTTERTTSSGSRQYPANYQLIFNPKGVSKIVLGPFRSGQDQEILRAQAQLKGTLILTPLRHEVVIGGSQLGLSGGEVFLLGKTRPALSDFSLIAEQLWGIHRGVVFGKTLRFESDLHLVDLLEGKPYEVDPDALHRHVLYIADRQPFSVEGFWRLLRRELEGKAP